jgi:hypothetical protein
MRPAGSFINFITWELELLVRSKGKLPSVLANQPMLAIIVLKDLRPTGRTLNSVALGSVLQHIWAAADQFDGIRAADGS